MYLSRLSDFLYCNAGVVETEWHFAMECSVYSDICISYEDILKINNLSTLFEGARMEKTANQQWKKQQIC